MNQLHKISILGDSMLDKYLFGAVERISPEAPVPVVHVQREEYRLGGAANVAHNIAALLGKATLYSIKGQDDYGAMLDRMIEEVGGTARWFDAGKPTITKVRVIAQKQQIVRLDYEETENLGEAPADMAEAVEAQLEQDEIVILSDYGKGALPAGACQAVIQAAREKGAKVVVDPKGTDWSKYAGAYLVTPNVKELAGVAGQSVKNENDAIHRIGQTVREQHQLGNLLVTRSEKGMTLLGQDTVEHHATLAKEVFDVSGAGDTVVATVALELARGRTLADAMHIANVAAGLVVAKSGTATVSQSELSAELDVMKGRHSAGQV